MTLREDANTIMKAAIAAALPDAAVNKALQEIDFGSRNIHLVAIGKAAWKMASTACEWLGDQLIDGFVITKYDHSKGDLDKITIFEAGHPIPDANTYLATGKVMEAATSWGEQDAVLFLISGGGSALFEQPLIPEEELGAITAQLLASGASIVEMNIIRKRLSAVKGGRFAEICAPAKVYSVILSDVLGDPIDMIASGPAYPDSSSCEDALRIVKQYALSLSDDALALLQKETPKSLCNVETRVSGSVSQLCAAAASVCSDLGYEPVLLTDLANCTARDLGSFFASIARTQFKSGKSLAYIVGGETVVKLTGKGLGGRNQELALAAADGISGLAGVAVFSLGSDGTDGPTDAAGGYVDGETAGRLKKLGVSICDILADNDSYHALKSVDGLIVTGPTGTNVNDLSVLLIKHSSTIEKNGACSIR